MVSKPAIKSLAFVLILSFVYSAVFGQWRKIDSLHADYRQIYFFNDTLGFLCGDDGLIKKTTDGGESWNFRSINTNDPVTSVYFITEKIGFATTIAGSIYKSIDGGNTWVQKIKYGILYNLKFLNDSIGYAVFTIPFSSVWLYKTVDQGETWNMLSGFGTGTLSYHGFDIFAELGVSANSIIIAVDAGLFLNYNLVNNSWNYVVDSTSGSLDGMSMPSANEAFACFDGGSPYYIGRGGIYRTMDGGASWENILVASIYSIQMINDSIGYAGGYEGIYKSGDSGSTWNLIDSLDHDITSLTITQHFGYAISYNHLLKSGSILKLGLVTNVENNPRGNVSILPNPFSNQLYIHRSNAEPSNFRIIGGDGRVYYSAVLTSPEITINTSAFPTGIYFAEIPGSKKSQIYKILKVK